MIGQPVVLRGLGRGGDRRTARGRSASTTRRGGRWCSPTSAVSASPASRPRSAQLLPIVPATPTRARRPGRPARPRGSSSSRRPTRSSKCWCPLYLRQEPGSTGVLLENAMRPSSSRGGSAMKSRDATTRTRWIDLLTLRIQPRPSGSITKELAEIVGGAEALEEDEAMAEEPTNGKIKVQVIGPVDRRRVRSGRTCPRSTRAHQGRRRHRRPSPIKSGLRGGSSTSGATRCARSPCPPTDGLVRGMPRRCSTPARDLACPVGEGCLGRVINVLGEPVDEAVRSRPRACVRSTARRRSTWTCRPDDRDLRDGHQGGRPARSLRQGRQDRPVRRRRRGQDGHHHGAHQQHREAARRLLGVLRRGRAHPRGQRPLARDGVRVGLRSSTRRR